MKRGEIKLMLASEIATATKKIAALNASKADADGPRSSWSSHHLQDLEQDIAQHTAYLQQCREILSSLQKAPAQSVEEGAIVTLNIEGEREDFLAVKSGGGDIKGHLLISKQSPIGKAIWGERAGEEAKAETPQGTLSIKIVAIS